MAIANYGDLKTAVRSFFADRSDIPAYVYELASAELSARLDLLVMQKTADLTTTGGTETVALPSDFGRVVHAYLDVTPRIALDAVSPWEQSADHRTSGKPYQYAIVKDTMVLNPVPDGAYTIKLRYVARLTTFSADADTNAVLTTYPGVYLYASLKHAAAWAQDAEAFQGYERALEAEIARARADDQRAKFGGGPLRSRAWATP